MKKKVIYICLFFTLIISFLFIAYLYQEQINKLSSDLEISNSKIIQTEELLQEANNHIEDLQITLEHRDSELERALNIQYEELTIEEMCRLAASTYDIDYDMLYAIAKLETENFTSDVFINNNNPGVTINNESLSFESKQEGIMEMARILKYDYIDQGLTTVEQIAIKYCPSSSDNWASEVRQSMNEQ